ncbi:chemokine XC receptor 1-like [Pimephales promelas]|uniref:chemokine XC receptor 1-like n=1 Tax=Pimephales promelas TaxID=90988 RepID=UPI001955C10C|nr:chemokine XC receptor 1-like [Pimephales promelas]XP_039533338.1 chemokine XC receptor 1-like [Pimephales promelas]
MADQNNIESDYYYDYNISDADGVCDKTKVDQFGRAVTPILFIIIVLFSCVGNTLVLYVLAKYENLKSLTNTFLLNLAISDLIFTSGLPFWAYYYMYGWTLGDPACKAVNYVFYTGYYSSIIFLTVLTVHRYMAVVHPMSVVMSRKSLHCYATSIVIWIISFCAAIPQAMFNSVVDADETTPVQLCDFEGEINWKLQTVYLQNFFFVVSFVIIAFCYTVILTRLLRPTSHTRKKTVQLIFFIVVFFFLGWGPYNVAIFLDSLTSWGISPFNECEVSRSVDYWMYISRMVALSHCCLNPVFYVFMGIKFRNHLKKMSWAFRKKNNEPQNRHSRLIYSNGEEISMY